MKIGILTFHHSLNCGAMLQAFALQAYLTQSGYDAELIDYGKIGWGSKYYARFDSMRHIAGMFYNNALTFMRTLLIESYRRSLYERFMKDFMRLSCKVSKKGLGHLPYTHLICGSDQIWHPIINEGDDSYFLSFARPEQKLISYAPSFGVDKFSLDLESRMGGLLNRFDAISVREPVGAAIVKRLSGKPADVVCDPTLLLDCAAYKVAERKPFRSCKDYVFVYTVGNHPWAEEYAERVARQMNKRVVHLMGGFLARWYRCKGLVTRISAVGPAEFLWLMHHASYIVTNSFHGSVFALTYQVPFTVALNDNAADSRMLQLCAATHTDARLAKTMPSGMITEKIDWNDLQLARQEYAQSGKQFLSKVLGAN